MESTPVQETTNNHLDTLEANHSYQVSGCTAVGGQFLEYRKLVGDISEKLRKENALRLAYSYDLPAWYYEVGPTYDASHSLKILIALEGKGVFSPKDMSGLAEALDSINREDLSSLVEDFKGDALGRGGGEGRPYRRHNTHPQKAMRQVWSNYSVRERSKPHVQHSTSLTSIAAALVFPDEPDGIMRAQSKPEFETVQRDSPHLDVRLPSSLDPGPAEHHRDVDIGLEFALMNSETLLNQLRRLQMGSDSQSPRNTSLNNALVLSQKLTTNLQMAAGKKFNHRSTPVRESESSMQGVSSAVRKFSRCSSAGQVGPPPPQGSGLSTPTSGVFMSSIRSRQATEEFSGHNVELEQGTRNLRMSDSMFPKQTAADLSPPNPEVMYRSARLPTRLYRKRSRKFNRKGLLVWQLKLKRLKEWCKRSDVKIESEDFYDSHKRKFKALLHPHGIGADTGNHMTLCIDCLEEPKSQSVSATNIVVSVIDPQSSSPTIAPITRNMERRGIRVIQQFVSHRQVEEFHSDVMVITVAVTGKQQEESEDSGDSARE